MCVTLLAVSYGWSQCKSGDPFGHFEGWATSAQAGKLDIALNLSCTDGRYAGTLTTPIGSYTVTAGSFREGHLRLQFAQGGATQITVETKIAGSELRGTFMSGDDKGPLQLQRTGEAQPRAANEVTLSLTAQQWKEDLSYFARELPKRHPNPFVYTPKNKFEAAVAELENKIDNLNSDAVYIGLDHLANLIGDAHTYVEFPDDSGNLPVDIGRFGHESRVVAVAAGYEQALGTRVIAIDDTPLKKAREFAAAITPIGETDSLKDSRIDGFITTGMVLHGLGITPDGNSARYKLATDAGKQLFLDFKALVPKQEPQWVNAAKQLPISERPVEGSAVCTFLSEARVLYCNVRRIGDLAAPSKEMLAIIKRERPDKVAIDLRHNGGGDYNEGLKYLIEPLRREEGLNRKGHLFVLIGANTFSAAMSNAAQFRTTTKAILVGQPIGERPNSYQEPRQFSLPNSHLVVRYSTRYYKFADKGDNVVLPDKEIIPTWEDHKGGRDPVLEWVLALKE